jgi:hypothetical protein
MVGWTGVDCSQSKKQPKENKKKIQKTKQINITLVSDKT